MSREQANIVYVSGSFLDKKEEIQRALKRHDQVELRAKDTCIEMAIQLAEHFVKKGWATYEQFRSSLTANDSPTIPQVLIRLNYRPSTPAEDEQQPSRKVYRERERNAKDSQNERPAREQRGKSSEEPRGRGQRGNNGNTGNYRN